MANNKLIAVAVGVGIFGVFAIMVVWLAGTAENPELMQGGHETKLSTASTTYGTIILPEAISRFEADGTKGYVTVEPGEQSKRLPAGRYNIRFWKIERKDEGGNNWALAGHYFGQDNPFDIKDGVQTKLDVGEPIIATVEARNIGSGYAFNQVIKGRSDEIVEITRNGSRPQPPKLHIKNKDGSYEQTYTFQYG